MDCDRVSIRLASLDAMQVEGCKIALVAKVSCGIYAGKWQHGKWQHNINKDFTDFLEFKHSTIQATMDAVPHDTKIRRKEKAAGQKQLQVQEFGTSRVHSTTFASVNTVVGLRLRALRNASWLTQQWHINQTLTNLFESTLAGCNGRRTPPNANTE